MEHFDLDGALLGLDDGNDIAARQIVAGLLKPLDKRSFLHIGAKGRHAEIHHRRSTPAPRPQFPEPAECSDLQVAGVGNGNLGAAHARHRCIERVERPFHDAGTDFGRETATPPAFVHDDGTMGLFDGREDSLVVKWPQTTAGR